MKTAQHLKAYVQLHPDNKMAWYLLGKEYYKNGQEGKANYCFNEAGEVYEAFEHSKVPSEVLREYKDGVMRASFQRHNNRMKVRRSLIGLMLLILLLIPLPVAQDQRINEDTGKTAVAESIEDTSKDHPEVTSNTKTEVQFTAKEAGSAASGVAFMTLLQNKKTPAFIAALGLERSGKWLLWKQKLPLNFTLSKTGNGRAAYQSYDPVACSCQPPEHSDLSAKAAKWQERQEDLAVLWSAMNNFNANKGRPPASLKELASPFPGNWLGGTTTVMKKTFTALQKASNLKTNQDKDRPTDSVQSPSSEGALAGTKENAATPPPAAAKSEMELPFFTEPLSIIVDKQKHRLAIVSGSIILRNYEVGTGGDRTPEGSFVIADKVVNPNGHDNGEFGSRGLQLSDSNYAIHGTNKPDSIGKDESLGCIRMKREDVEELFAMVPKGTKVQISKGVLPSELLLPKERYSPTAIQNQTNPHKVYHWLD